MYILWFPLVGFVFIVNPFRSGFQQYWVKRCLMDYPDRPNRCNLDAHIQLGAGDNLWRLSQQQDRCCSILSLTVSTHVLVSTFLIPTDCISSCIASCFIIQHFVYILLCCSLLLVEVNTLAVYQLPCDGCLCKLIHFPGQLPWINELSIFELNV